jgi:hypothetical protein
MNFLKKCALLYDKIDYEPDFEEVFETTTGLAVTRRCDVRATGTY